jgi:hypothetical protein
MFINYLQACTIEASGSLVVNGTGTFNCDVFVAGDLVCEAEGATIRGGQAKVGGRVRLNELGAPGGSKIVVELEGKTTTEERLTAKIVNEGVKVICNGVEVGFDARRVNLTVGVDDEKHVSHFSLVG